MKRLLVAILISLPVFAEEAPALTLVSAACGADNVKFKVQSKGRQPAAQPEPGKALVYVVEEFGRPGNEIGRPTIRVGLDGAWVGANRGTSYLSFSVEPGEHHLCADWQSLPPWLSLQPAFDKLTAASAKTYYFRARVLENHGYFTLDLDEMNSDEGQFLVSTLAASDFVLKK